ncbi:MAG: PepSY domain-containing protein, partial [Psychrosphaera sp.]|nr:PepSY domain-containing protein [Psychrosphaera sp.]
DSGYFSMDAHWQGKPLQITDIDRLHDETVAKYQQKPTSIRVHNYGDQGAVVHFRGEQKSGFGQRYEVAYALENNQNVFRKDADSPNAVSRGMAVAAKLHFGNYAGTDLRLVYFLLGLGVCALIVTGNLLWIDKKAKQRKSSPKTVALVTNVTLLGSAGVVLATAVAFMFERTLPADLTTRASIMVYSFVATLGATGIYLYFDKNKTRCLSVLMAFGALVLVLVVIVDWLMFSQTIIDLWHKGVKTIVATEVGLLSIAAALGFAAVKLRVRSRDKVVYDARSDVPA